MGISLLIFVLLVTALSTWPYRLYRNYLDARKTGLCLIISPITPFELPWHICPAIFGSIIKRQRWFRALDQTCSWQDKNLLHEKLGSCFIHVSPGLNMLCTSDPTAIEYVYKKTKEFVKPDVMKTLDFFGPNIITVNDEAWARHRKLTAPCFNERVSTFVWDESLRQASDMLQEWLAKPEAKSNAIVQDSGTVALHVLTAAAFGEQRDFHEGVNKLAPNHKLSFREALKTVLRNPITAALVGQMPILTKPPIQPILSKRIKSVQLGLREFKSYMLEAIARERKAASSNSSSSTSTTTTPTTTPSKRPNLLNALVKASDEAKAENPKASSYMTDAELTGNMFMFAFAGHETTATTISYSLALLAINPDMQSWLAEELEHVTRGLANDAKLTEYEYAKIQPRLKRTLAVMYETVRLYGVPPPWRDVGVHGGTSPSGAVDTPLHILISPPSSKENEKEKIGESQNPIPLFIPPNTQISLNVYAAHTSPSNFGENALVWDPRRWIIPSSSSNSPNNNHEKSCNEGSIDTETFLTNQKGFFAWGGGPRVCPGMKFAQVEFTAVMLTVLRRWRVVPALSHSFSHAVAHEGEGNGNGVGGEGGKGKKDRQERDREEYERRAKEGVERVLKGSMASIALNFGEPEELWVRLVER